MVNNLIPKDDKVSKVATKNIDYHVSLINKFSVNNLLSDSVTFAEEINVDL